MYDKVKGCFEKLREYRTHFHKSPESLQALKAEIAYDKILLATLATQYAMAANQTHKSIADIRG